MRPSCKFFVPCSLRGGRCRTLKGQAAELLWWVQLAWVRPPPSPNWPRHFVWGVDAPWAFGCGHHRSAVEQYGTPAAGHSFAGDSYADDVALALEALMIAMCSSIRQDKSAGQENISGCKNSVTRIRTDETHLALSAAAAPGLAGGSCGVWWHWGGYFVVHQIG